MKLRIDSHQIRFRLTMVEAEKLLNEQMTSETLHLPVGKKLNYQIKIANQTHLTYTDNTFILSVPAEQLKNLIQNPTKKGLASFYQEENRNIDFSLEIDMPCDVDC